MSRLNEARHARQSAVRVRSGLKLVGVLTVVSIAAALLQVWWLAKLGATGVALFLAVTLLEYWNTRRLGRKQ